MKIKSLFALLAVLVLATFSAAQDGAVSALQGSLADSVGLPGQGWTSIGNQSPIEHNNFYLQSYVEQGAAVFSTYSGSFTVTPFVGLGMTLDTKGYEWNNKVQPRLGVKVNKYFAKGVISVGSAYSYEDRFKSFDSSALTLFVQDWFGWQSVAEKSSRFPGSTWIEAGNLSPVEKGNILGLGYITQGVVAKRFSRATLVPYLEATVFKDSKGFDWDNKATVGGGVKAVLSSGQVYTEIGAAYLHETRFQSGQSAGGVSVFTNFSFNWNLLGRKAGR
ncbi:MAG TPA: hypothetical protein VEU11_03825 [Terriglobales bacterium]|jgi:hypothetical protein|nr:hypothetical protein [Terriglobales bacterium]